MDEFGRRSSVEPWTECTHVRRRCPGCGACLPTDRVACGTCRATREEGA